MKIVNPLQLAQRNLNFTIFESAITAGMLCMAIMTPFFKSIGLSQTEISLTQIIYTIVALVLDFPAGWLADRLSRKAANIIGDFGVVVILLCYSTVHGFWGAVICECAMGFCMALSQGVDKALIRHFSHKMADLVHEKTTSEQDLKAKEEATYSGNSAKTEVWRSVDIVIISLLGAPIGAMGYRLAIALSGVTYLLGGIASLLVVDDSPKLEPTYKNPFKDMARIFRQSLKNRRLVLGILAYTSSREATHAIIWVLTPILLYAGIPLKLVSIAWVMNAVACVIGANLAKKYAASLQDYQKIAFPIVLVSISMLVLSIKINLITVWIYCLLGVVQGWTNPALAPIFQKHALKEEQTAVASLASTFCKIVYLLASLITGVCADVNLQLVPLATFIIFVPFGACVAWQLYHEQPSDERADL